jgi:cytochrome c oxidase subunit IV
MQSSNYKKLGFMLPVNALIMFVLTYALIDTSDHFYPNLNRAYMAVLMVAPMGLVMLVFMKGMYTNRRLNSIIAGLFAGLFVMIFAVARSQTFIGNEQFLRSMIPHHSSAILMCERSELTDPDIVALCKTIVAGQKEEISKMKILLKKY